MTIAGGIVEYFAPGDRISFTSSGSVTGGNIVQLVGDRTVELCSASTVPVGVALHNAADGELVSVALTGVWPCKCTTTAAAGALLAAAANGSLGASTNTAPQFFVGIAMEAISAGAVGPVKVRL
jgi:hypothetical protein